MKVLAIVDDEPDMRELIRLWLGVDERLVVVAEAASAAEAIELAKLHRPDLVVLDHFINGGVMGLAAAPTIKAAVAGVKILLFSALDLETEAGLEPSIDAFLHKRDHAALLGTVQRLLGLNKNLPVP